MLGHDLISLETFLKQHHIDRSLSNELHQLHKLVQLEDWTEYKIEMLVVVNAFFVLLSYAQSELSIVLEWSLAFLYLFDVVGHNLHF